MNGLIEAQYGQLGDDSDERQGVDRKVKASPKQTQPGSSWLWYKFLSKNSGAQSVNKNFRCHAQATGGSGPWTCSCSLSAWRWQKLVAPLPELYATRGLLDPPPHVFSTKLSPGGYRAPNTPKYTRCSALPSVRQLLLYFSRDLGRPADPGSDGEDFVPVMHGVKDFLQSCRRSPAPWIPPQAWGPWTHTWTNPLEPPLDPPLDRPLDLFKNPPLHPSLDHSRTTPLDAPLDLHPEFTPGPTPGPALAKSQVPQTW